MTNLSRRLKRSCTDCSVCLRQHHPGHKVIFLVNWTRYNRPWKLEQRNQVFKPKEHKGAIFSGGERIWWLGGEVTGYSWASFSHRKHPRKIHAKGEVTLSACPVGSTNISRRITCGIGFEWGMPSLSLFILSHLSVMLVRQIQGVI